MRVSSLLPFYTDDVLGDAEGRGFGADFVMSAGCISCRSSCALAIVIFFGRLLVLRVGVNVDLTVYLDVWGQPLQELSQLVHELACHHCRMLVAELIGG